MAVTVRQLDGLVDCRVGGDPRGVEELVRPHAQVVTDGGGELVEAGADEGRQNVIEGPAAADGAVDQLGDQGAIAGRDAREAL
ncbi:hypothetical protein D3C86_1626740 [compost metagenome]